MADNVPITAGSGTTVATDQVAGTLEHVQLFKLAYSADGSRTLVQVDANGLLVNLASVPTHAVTGPVTDTQLRATAVPVSLASVPSHAVTGPLTDTQLRATAVPVSGTVTASGPLTDTQLRASAVPVSLASVPSHAVTNAGTFAVQSAATLAAETTKVIGTVNIAAAQSVTANAGTNLNTSALALDATLTGRFPAAAALADGAANPSATAMGSNTLLYNGTTWDREHGNWRTTTGDTGAKVATFNGATQTNFDAVGAWILIQLGTVSGTTPTLSVQLQVSFDAGTNWLALGPVLANLTASSQTGAIYVYPANVSQAVGATPANMTIGATVSNFLNLSLPRTWRLQYTIGGTTPSFAITAVHVNYLR